MRFSRRRIELGAALSAILIALLIVASASTPFLPDKSRAEAAEQVSNEPTQSAAIPPFRARPGRDRPLVAVVAYSGGTETTDFIIPYGVLSQSGAADVITVGTKSGPVQMIPALKIVPQMNGAEFDARFPQGADYLFVPAVYNPKDQVLLDWVRSQSRRGAVIIGICDGAWVLANAGLLTGRRATGHWHSLDSLQRKFATTTWARDRRYVADGPIVTTTGVTASIPVSLALVAAIAGQEQAMKVAEQVGAADWSPVHNSNDFRFDWSDRLTAAGNELSFWSHESIGIPISPATDEIALALVADAYSRTFRSHALTVSASEGPVRTRRGLTVIAEVAAGSKSVPARVLPSFESLPPVQALDWALAGIADAYGEPTAAFVATQMEYQRPAPAPSPARATRE